MLRSGKDLNAFIACYRRQIQMLQSALPQTAVYINSILPLRRDVMRRNGGEHRYHSYNRALKDMCDALQLTFIDNSSLMEWEDEVYEFDGIHPKYPYYPKWLRYMAACAGLLPKESD